MGLGELWTALVDAVCRPPRDSQYTVEDLVGGSAGRFSIPGHKGYSAKRQDLLLTNKRGLKLQCSWYVPENVAGRDGKLPCIIYCHCNSGSRRDCEEALFQMLPLGVSVFALDFAGSGLSEGEWVTLGAHEVDDVEMAVQYLRGSGRVSTLGLWGRSMGAVTALLYSQRDPSIAGMVLDSPFSCLTDLMLELVAEQELPIPKALMKVALAAMKRSVRKRAGFDITAVSPLSVVGQSFIPALFCHATGDTFIKIHHSERLFAAYAGDKNFVRVEGDHNSARPRFFKSSVAIFFTNTLQLDQQLVSGNSELLEYKKQLGTAQGMAAAAAQAAAQACAGDNALPLSRANSSTHPGHGGIPWQLQSLRSTSTLPRLPTSTSAGERGDVHEGAVPTSRNAHSRTTLMSPKPSNFTPTRPHMAPHTDALADAGAQLASSWQAAGEQLDAEPLDEDEAADEALLMQAIQASLLDLQSQQASTPPCATAQGPAGAPVTHGSSSAPAGRQLCTAGTGTVAAPGAVPRPQAAGAGGAAGGSTRTSVPPGLHGLVPGSAEDEADMLQRAIALSLQAEPPQPPGHQTPNGPPAGRPAADQPAYGAPASPAGTSGTGNGQATNYVDVLMSELSAGLTASSLATQPVQHGKEGAG